MGHSAADRWKRRRLFAEYSFRCGYCRNSADLEIDHYQPTALGGDDEQTNLIVACRRCNQNKRAQDPSAFEDPLTGARVGLFNPSRDEWNAHFDYRLDGQLVGTSEVGRATASRLFRLTPGTPSVVLDPPSIARLGSPAQLEVGSLQRLRLANTFDQIEVGLPDLRSGLADTAEEVAAIAWALDALELGMLHTRADASDLHRAELLMLRTWGEHMYPEQPELWFNKRTVHFAELATVAWLRGHYETSIRLQQLAADAFKHFRTRQGSTHRRPSFFDDVREFTLKHKYLLASSPTDLTETIVNEARGYCQLGDTAPIRFVADWAAFCTDVPIEKLEMVSSILEFEITRCGYGQDFDLAAGAMLRRRWWLLQARLGIGFSSSVLEHDIATWTQWELFNEPREVAAAFDRLTPLMGGRRSFVAAAEARNYILSEVGIS